MRDMKAGFRLYNPTLVDVNWSFVPEESGETAAEELEVEEGEVTGAAHASEEVVVLDDQEQLEAAE